MQSLTESKEFFKQKMMALPPHASEGKSPTYPDSQDRNRFFEGGLLIQGMGNIPVCIGPMDAPRGFQFVEESYSVCVPVYPDRIASSEAGVVKHPGFSQAFEFFDDAPIKVHYYSILM